VTKDVMFHRLWTKAVGTSDYDKSEWLWLDAHIGKTEVSGLRIPIETIKRLVKVTGVDRSLTAEQVIEVATRILESDEWVAAVRGVHAKNPPGDLRGSGRGEGDAPTGAQGQQLGGDSGSGVGTGAGERAAEPVRGDVPSPDARAPVFHCDGGAEGVCDHRALRAICDNHQDTIYELRQGLLQIEKERNAALAKLADAERITRLADNDTEMYASAWERELGPPFVGKSHRIDALVLTTRERMAELTRWRALEARGNRCFNCRGPHHTESCDQPEVNPT
jgi:hypothetical protein